MTESPAPASGSPPGYVPPPGYGWYGVKPPPFVPGVAFYAITAFVVCVGLVDSSMPELTALGFVAVMVGLTIGLVWLIAFWIAAADTRLRISRATWARWVGIPAMCFGCLALMLSDVPATARFELSRPALEQAAASARSGTHYGSGWIGLIPVREVRVNGPATVFVISGSAESGDECAITHGDAGDSYVRSLLDNSFGVRDYGNGWWYACSYPWGD